MPDIAWGPLPFKEAIEAFRARAFKIAGVMRDDVLGDLRKSIGKAIAEGTAYGEFRKEVRSIMERRGWTGLAPYRLDNIYRTNIQAAYQAGHYARQMQTVDTRPYWQYVAVMDGRTRPTHRAAHGMVFRYDDPFWSANYPPNGYRCRCTVRSLSAAEVDREKLTVSIDGPLVADAGWDHNPALDLPQAGRTLKPEKKQGLAARVPVRAYADIERLLKTFDSENPGLFERGAPRIEVSRSSRAFMSTDCQGRISLYSHSFRQCNGFNAATELKSALSKLGKGKELTFHEEYAIESLWHEVNHNAMKHIDLYMSKWDICRQLMETVNQFCSRHTYPEFLQKLGGAVSHKAQVLEKGYGYGPWVTNIRSLIARLGCREEAVLSDLRKINVEGYWEDRLEDIARALHRHQEGRRPEGTINRVVRRITKDSPAEFSRTLEAMLAEE
jgi:SPP1 gp7 family putative phage head morphogenesis protein